MARAVTAQFITVARADLFALTQRIFESVPDDALRDPANPLTVGVNGTMESGKKIIADAAVEYLFDKDTAAREGIGGRDEYWTGQRGARPFEIDYIDVAYQDREEYSPRLQHDQLPADRDLRATQRYGEKIYLFLRQRAAGGITFLQNAQNEMSQPSLSFFIEKTSGSILSYTDPRWVDTPLSMRYEFQSIARKNFWTRLVSVDVRDERLLDDSRFMADFRAFSPFSTLTRRHAAPAAVGMTSTVNVFGRDFPHPL